MGVLSVTRGTYSPMGRGVFHPRPVLKPSEAVLGGSRAVPGRFLERETGGDRHCSTCRPCWGLVGADKETVIPWGSCLAEPLAE